MTTHHTYMCAHCRGTFVADWSQEEAYEEAARLWGMTREECDASPQVCDDCFQAMTAEVPPSPLYAEADRVAAAAPPVQDPE